MFAYESYAMVLAYLPALTLIVPQFCRLERLHMQLQNYWDIKSENLVVWK